MSVGIQIKITRPITENINYKDNILAISIAIFTHGEQFANLFSCINILNQKYYEENNSDR